MLNKAAWHNLANKLVPGTHPRDPFNPGTVAGKGVLRSQMVSLTREDGSHISRLQLGRELHSILVRSSHVMMRRARLESSVQYSLLGDSGIYRTSLIPAICFQVTGEMRCLREVYPSRAEETS